eukprot:29219-Pelagococcus_subviridis.AAC.3
MLFYKSTRSRQSMLCSCDSDTNAVVPCASRVMSSNMPCSYRAKNGVCAMLKHTARSSSRACSSVLPVQYLRTTYLRTTYLRKAQYFGNR